MSRTHLVFTTGWVKNQLFSQRKNAYILKKKLLTAKSPGNYLYAGSAYTNSSEI